jgi:hypothetical protein
MFAGSTPISPPLIRLCAAQGLAWALANSPAFLFNSQAACPRRAPAAEGAGSEGPDPFPRQR